MFNRSIYAALFVLLALAVPATASAASSRTGAVVFSRISEEGGVAKGGLYAAKEGHLNQLTENPGDSEPDFSADGRTIVFARAGDIYSVRADGSGERMLTSGSQVDGHPIFSPNGKIVVFERRASEAAPRDLYTVRATGGSSHALTTTGADEHEASISDDGCMIAFVRSVALSSGGTADDIYSVRPAGVHLRRLTSTPGTDEFAPHYFGEENIVFSRGQSGDGPDAYADIYTMRENGSTVRPRRAGARCSSAAIRASGSSRSAPAARASSASCRTVRRPAPSSPPTAAASLLLSPPKASSHSLRSTSPAAAAPISPKATTPGKADRRRRSARSSPGSRCGVRTPPAPARKGPLEVGGGPSSFGGDITAAWENLRSARRSPATGSIR
jgi:dipeptidyl aminopeptidase/acylaminoacyl peptidase